LWLNKSKTFERRVRLTFASSYLRAWLDCHPTKSNLKSPIFSSLKPPYGLLSDTGLYHRIIKIHNKAGIKRKATPRHIRHSRATNLVKKLNGSEQKLKSIMGWEQNSRMASTYVHLDDNDVDEMMLEAAGIKKEEEKPDKPLNYKCQRCGEINAVTQKRCWKCGFSEDDPIIDEETIAKSVEEIVLEKLQAQGFIIGSKPLKKESNRKYIEKEE
jgi:ribosomal protein L37E